MATVPTDLVTEILRRSLVESLLRFRCLSKSFCRLIDSPDFINLHLRTSIETNSNHHLIVKLNTDDTTLYSVDLNSQEPENNIIRYDRAIPEIDLWDEPCFFYGSSNGLLALFSDKEEHILLNPSTKEYQILPKPLPTSEAEKFMFQGFGYDVVSDDYKFVRIIAYYNHTDVAVYSLKLNSWSYVRNLTYRFPYDPEAAGVFLNGVLHWALTYPDISKIITFDLATNKVGQMSMPELYKVTLGTGLVVLRGRLCLYCDYEEELGRLDIWIMKDYGLESWTKLYSLNKPQAEGIIEFYDSLLVIAYINDGDKIIIQNEDGEYLLLVDTKRREIKKFLRLFEDQGIRPIITHMNSLVSPKRELGVRSH